MWTCGVVGVVVADSRPSKLSAEVLLHPVHELLRVGSEVELVPVFRGDDEPELSLLFRQFHRERLAFDVAIPVEESPLRSVLLNAVALEVGEVCARGLRAASSCRHVPCFDHAAPRALGGGADVMSSSLFLRRSTVSGRASAGRRGCESLEDRQRRRPPVSARAPAGCTDECVGASSSMQSSCRRERQRVASFAASGVVIWRAR